MVRHVAPHMMERRSGKIINIGSGTPYKGVPRMLPYVASKGAILAFTRALSRELGEYGIAVNSLSPGFILSDTGLENRGHVEEERIPVRNSRAFKRDAYPGRPARRARISRVERQRFRDGPVARGRWRVGQ